MLRQKLLDRDGDILLYGTTPPRLSTPPDRLREIAARQTARINEIAPDGIVLYDIQDETERNPDPRPFPFGETLDPLSYGRDLLSDLSHPRIYYRATGKYAEPAFRADLSVLTEADATVFVGAASRTATRTLSLSRAYALHRETGCAALLGGVTIPERHAADRDEHRRVAAKMRAGCRFFITQCVYDVAILARFLSDYRDLCDAESLVPVPMIVTLTPCGSPKTLDFMRWLGIAVAGPFADALRDAPDMLDRSVELCTVIARDILGLARTLRLPVGFNIESVSIRKAEIDASAHLSTRVRDLLR